MFSGQNIIVLDLETLHSAEDLPTGWEDKVALGLSIGAYFDYKENQVYWFDQSSLADTMRRLVDRWPLMVSFNGSGFDFVLMSAVLRRRADISLGHQEFRLYTLELCNRFDVLAAESYDILAEIWRMDPDRKYERGLNSLDALLVSNHLPAKSGHGAHAPRDWQAGRIADVLNYCQRDVWLTRLLFELICQRQGQLMRGDGRAMQIRYVTVEQSKPCVTIT